MDGDLYTFGESANGRLGLQVGQLPNHRVPQQVQSLLGRFTQVSCGGEHTVALTGRLTVTLLLDGAYTVSTDTCNYD